MKLLFDTHAFIWYVMADLGVTDLPITVKFADVQAALPNLHRDPFDRMLVSQAIVENLTIVRCDTAFDGYGITRLW